MDAKMWANIKQKGKGPLFSIDNSVWLKLDFLPGCSDLANVKPNVIYITTP